MGPPMEVTGLYSRGTPPLGMVEPIPMGIACSRPLLVEHKAQLQLHQRHPPGLRSRKALVSSNLGL
jgi:hypothetical protein